MDYFSSFGLRSLLRQEEYKAPVSSNIKSDSTCIEKATSEVFKASQNLQQEKAVEYPRFSRVISDLEERFLNEDVISPGSQRVSSPAIAIKQRTPPSSDFQQPYSFCLDVAERMHRARSSTGTTTVENTSNSKTSSVDSKTSSVVSSFSRSPGSSGYSLSDFE